MWARAAGMLAPPWQSWAVALFRFTVEDMTTESLAWKRWQSLQGVGKYLKSYRQHRLIAQALRHIHINYSGSFLSTCLCLNRLRHFTSLLQAANSAINSQDLCRTKEYIPCTSEISTAIQMYFAQPEGFKVNIHAVPQGFARLMF